MRIFEVRALQVNVSFVYIYIYMVRIFPQASSYLARIVVLVNIMKMQEPYNACCELVWD